MSKLDHRGTNQLRKGRRSIPGARYFITSCTEFHKPGLSTQKIAEILIEALRELHRSQDLSLHCATVMPDHIHSVFTLGQRLTLSQTQAKFKQLTHSALEKVNSNWQENYYDHRIRQDVDIEPFARYVFLNPYRKQLLSNDEQWPWWVCNHNYTPEFYQHLIDGKYPPAQWIDTGDSVKTLIENDRIDDSFNR